MKEHDHPTKNKPEAKPAHEEVAKKAYANYEKEDHPQGNAEENWLEAEAQLQNAGAENPDVFLCGPPAMMDEVLESLKELGVAGGRIHYERFSI